jgi:DNA-binding transcriptional MocR family regulator
MPEKWQNIPVIDHKNHHYVYITVAHDIEDRIETGELASGEPLPGDMTLARLYGISRDSAGGQNRSCANAAKRRSST